MSEGIANARIAISLARAGRKVLLAVRDSTPAGKVFNQLSDAIRDEGVHGFKFFEDKLFIEHGSGGRIKISCEKHIVEGQLGGLLFHDLVGGEDLSKTARDIAKPYVRLKAGQ